VKGRARDPSNESGVLEGLVGRVRRSHRTFVGP